MKKTLIFLILLCAIFISNPKCVFAEETKFYESQYIDMYMNKEFSTEKGTIYYQKARFFANRYTEEQSFCIEPTSFFDENATYYSTDNPYNLNSDQKLRIQLLGYFGFHYPNHNAAKWYSITQLMMWKTADPLGRYYFTNGLNGAETHKYDSDMAELDNLINNYLTKPNITVPKIIKSKRKIELIDQNNVLSNYKTNIGKISGNKLIIDNLSEGDYTIKLTREEPTTGKNSMFYESFSSQNMFTRGDIPKIEIELNLKVVDTSLKITKVNKDTQDSKDIGQATLKGTKFGLYNSKGELVKELIIDESGICETKDLDFDTYTLKELKSGTGYKINDKEIKITIDSNNPTIELTIENEIIKKEIIIHKTFGDNIFVGEENVTFEIYDENNNLVDTVTTDNEGYIKFYLTYGTYTLKQINSKKGYSKVEPIKIIVDNEDVLIIELKDYKIKVPNTYSKESFIQTIINYILGILND